MFTSKEITLIDSDDEKLSFPNNQLDIKVVEGDCTSISILNKANISNAWRKSNGVDKLFEFRKNNT